MSRGAVREDFWQSTARGTIRERCKSIFNQKLLSDVKFVVRDSQGGSESIKKIPVHKFVLAISSPVFFAMFYGELPESKDSIEISDCEYESLLEMFRFIYSDEANLKPDNVMQVMYLAKKYMLPALVDKCSAYLQINVNASNAFHVLPAAKKYEEKDLMEHCWKVVEKETKEAVKSDGFVAIERSVLEELVEKDSLNIKEVELFKAVNCWAEKECEKQGLAAEGSVKRRILGERVVKGIRFPVMEEKEFANIVLDCDILTKKECFDLVKYFNGVLAIPVGFSGIKRAGAAKQLNIISRFSSVKIGWHYSSDRTDTIYLSVDRNMKLHAVRLFGSKNSEYYMHLTVADFNRCVIADEAGNFLSNFVQSEIGNYQGFEIVFKVPIALQENKVYRFIAQISGPPSWYGQGGRSSVECSGVKFVFTKCNGYPTSVEQGQFSEFVFTLN